MCHGRKETDMPSLEDRERAFKEGPNQLEPFDVWPGDVDKMPPLPFPHLGGFVPHGWTLVKTYNLAEFPLTMKTFLFQVKVGKGYAFIDRDLIGEYKFIQQGFDFKLNC